jgi:hypothetical protein
MQNEHKPVVTDEGIETVTETDEAVLREIDRGIYRDRHKSYRSWNTWISESAAEFQRSKRTAQQLVDDQVQEITDLLHRAKADTRPHVQAAAGQLACSLSMMKLGISEGDVLGTAFRGMLVGRQAHQLWIKMEHEEKAKREMVRTAGKRKNDLERKSDSATRAETCCELFAEFTPAEIKKFGLPAVYRDIGKFAADRLKLSEPIKPRTVRSYIENANRDNG